MTTYPSDWKICKLGDVIRLKNGFAFKSSEYSDEGIPIIRISDINDGKVSANSSVRVPHDKANFDFLVEPGDLLIAMSGATTGKTGVYVDSEPVLQNQRVGNFKIIDESILEKKYRNYYVSSLRKEIEKAAYGGAQPNISAKGIEQFDFPLAPLEQQKRIVAEIEKQFSRLDEAVANLKRVKANLKRYKAAVLKAAVEGKLTEKWREEQAAKLAAQGSENAAGDTTSGAALETAEELLKRILAERRQQWEEAELAKMKAKGKAPKDDKWKKKYKEPSATRSSCLPESWESVTVEQVSILVTDGDHNPPKRVESGIPHLTAKNVINGRITEKGCTFITAEDFEKVRKRYDPQEEDVIVTCVGTIGRTAIVPGGYTFSADRNLAIVRLIKNGVLPQILQLNFDSPEGQLKIKNASGSTAQPHFYLANLRAFVIALMPKEEQREIMKIVEEKITEIEHLEISVEANLKRSERLRQSILGQAFRGLLRTKH